MNNYVCMGNLTRDPEVHTFASGTSVAKFGLAVSGRVIKKDGETVKDDNGYNKKEVVFWDCEVWGVAVEALVKYAKKGRPLLVQGEIKEESWEDKSTGNTRSKKVLRVKDYTFIGGKDDLNVEDTEVSEKKQTLKKGRPKKSEVINEGFVNNDDMDSIPF